MVDFIRLTKLNTLSDTSGEKIYVNPEKICWVMPLLSTNKKLRKNKQRIAKICTVKDEFLVWESVQDIQDLTKPLS